MGLQEKVFGHCFVNVNQCDVAQNSLQDNYKTSCDSYVYTLNTFSYNIIAL